MRRWIGSVLGAVAVTAVLVAPVALAAPGGVKGKPGGTTTTTTTTTTTPPLVSVTLEVELLDRATVGVGGVVEAPVRLPDRGDTERCSVVVPEGSDGAVVIEAARATGCITGYTLSYDDYGRPVSLVCLDDQCNTTAGYRWGPRNWLAGGGAEWTHYEGAQTIWWLTQFSAAEGDTLTVSYGATTGTCVPVWAIDVIYCIPIVQAW